MAASRGRPVGVNFGGRPSLSRTNNCESVEKNMIKTTGLLLGSFLSQCVPVKTELPAHLHSEPTIDALLPEALGLLEADRLDVLWVGAVSNDWILERHPLTGETTGRNFTAGYIHRWKDGKMCKLSYMKFYEGHVANGQFSAMKTTSRDYSPEQGDFVECGLAEKTSFGLRKGQGAAPAAVEAAPAEAPAEAAPAE